MNFDQAFEKLIGHEGGDADDPDDPGGRTRYGICKRSYPDVDIANLTLEEAKAIYLRDFWNPLKLDVLPSGIRFDLFDTGVNCGLDRARKLLQAAVGVKQDGKVGLITLAAANVMSGDLLDKRFNGYRLRFIASLDHFPKYARGWIRRIATNLIDD